MGLEDIFGKELKELKEARQLEKDYWDLADKYGLDYISGYDHFLVLANKRLSEDADHRKKDTPPWPGIKIHSPLSVEMYNVLKSNEFKEMLKNGEIDGIKVYLYDDPSTKHKEVTIYISPDSMPNLGKLLNILESILKNSGIYIQPVIPSYHDIVYLNRMHIVPNVGIFVRYSTDFTGKMNIDDYIIGRYRGKIDDHVWRTAADDSYPYIVAVSRSWLLNNQYKLNDILRDSSTIYTFITLKRINEETIVPNPNIILSYDDYKQQLKAYKVLDATTVEYDLSNIDDLERISNRPTERLYEFLKYGTISQQSQNDIK